MFSAWVDYILFATTVIVATTVAWAYLRFRRERASLPMWSIGLAGLAVLAGALTARSAETDIKRIVERMVSGFGPTYVNELIRNRYLAINLDTKPDNPTYLNIIECQKSWLGSNAAIADIYTIAMDQTGTPRLLVDSETDYDRNGVFEGERESRTAIGEGGGGSGGSTSPRLEVLGAFGGTPRFTAAPYTDRWGTWVSAYYPIFNVDGTVHSVLGIDFPAGEWLAEPAEARRGVLLGELLVVVMILVAGVIQGHLAGRVAKHRRESALVLARAQAAVDASRTKSLFLASVSHELRTPMTAILGFSDLLINADPSLEERDSHVRTIQRNAEHLLSLVNDLLDISKIEEGRMEVESVECDYLSQIEETVSSLRVRADAKKLSLRVEHQWPLPATIETDPLRFRQILNNLLSNAIKFTQSGGVTVKVSYDPARTKLQLEVIDTGVGIAPDQMSKLFNIFTQANPGTANQFGGTGLGLAISKRLTELLGGDLTVRSVPGSGSTFIAHFHAPAPKAQGGEAARAMLTTAPVRSSRSRTDHNTPMISKSEQNDRRIVLAEDGTDNQRLLNHILTRAGYNMTITDDGEACVRAVKESIEQGRPFDAVLTDIQMPKLDGYGATAAIRALGYRGPIIALTAHAMLGERERCLAAGCDAYLSKPIDRPKLLELLEKLLNKQATMI